MTTKYTPGPWKLSHGGLPGDSGFSIISNNAEAQNVKVTAECWPCTIVSEEHRQELFANARLIAAAPEMLEALVKAVARYEATLATCPHRDETRDELIAARAAIAKATAE